MPNVHQLLSHFPELPFDLPFSVALPETRTLLYAALMLAVVIAAKGVQVARENKRNPRRLPLPPGPKGLPIVSNMLQIPTYKPWEGYAKLCEEYGAYSRD